MDKKIAAIIRKACAMKEKIKSETKFSELSIDSLSFIELIVKTEDIFRIKFTDEELDINLYPTVAEFEKIIQDKVKNGNTN